MFFQKAFGKMKEVYKTKVICEKMHTKKSWKILPCLTIKERGFFKIRQKMYKLC